MSTPGILGSRRYRHFALIFSLEAATMKSAKKSLRKSRQRTTVTAANSPGFSAEEKAAMRERVEDMQPKRAADLAPARPMAKPTLAKSAAIAQPDRAMAEPHWFRKAVS
jgi:hypothetical protein